MKIFFSKRKNLNCNSDIIFSIFMLMLREFLRSASQTPLNLFISPSGGTLRDSSMNIVMYSAKYDKYKGYGKA